MQDVYQAGCGDHGTDGAWCAQDGLLTRWRSAFARMKGSESVVLRGGGKRGNWAHLPGAGAEKLDGAGFMQSQRRQIEKGKGEPAIRTGVLWAVLGVVLLCVVGIGFSLRRKGEVELVRVVAPVESGTRRVISSASPSSFRPTRRTIPSESAQVSGVTSRSEAQIERIKEVGRGVSNELRIAKEGLTHLRETKHYGDKHPEVLGQLARIQSLEQSAKAPPVFLDLAIARAELATLRVQFGEQHPAIQEQLRVIESLEHSVAMGEGAELAQAWAKLQSLRGRFSDEHPAVKEQISKVRELQR